MILEYTNLWEFCFGEKDKLQWNKDDFFPFRIYCTRVEVKAYLETILTKWVCPVPIEVRQNFLLPYVIKEAEELDDFQRNNKNVWFKPWHNADKTDGEGWLEMHYDVHGTENPASSTNSLCSIRDGWPTLGNSLPSGNGIFEEKSNQTLSSIRMF